MKIQLSDHFTFSRLLRFTFPSIIMMVYTSIYGVVDGFFVSNFAGSTQFAALNLIMPFIMIFSSVGFMAGAGGTALVAKIMGEGNSKRAKEVFSLLVYSVICAGIVCIVLAQLFMKNVALAFGATEELLPWCIIYGRIVVSAMPFFMLQNIFQTFLIAAERPGLGLLVTVIAGFANMILDWLFMAVFGWGVAGAATATGISQFFGGVIPLFYFIFNKNGKLKLGHAHFEGRTLLKVCGNGFSELMSNIAMSIVSIAYNLQLMKMIGANGVSAYGVIMYMAFIFISIIIGFAIGVSPVISFNYGAQNLAELRGLKRKSYFLMGVFGVVLVTAAELLSPVVAKLYVGYDKELYDLTLKAFRLYSFSFLLCGFNIFSSTFFTALNDGFTSAFISLSRVLVFQIAAVFILPLIFGPDGIWASICVAEICSLCVSLGCLFGFQKKYRY